MAIFGTRPENRTTGNRPCRYCGVKNWKPIHKCQATEKNCNKNGEKGHYAKVCRKNYINNRTVKTLTEEEIDTRNETSNESDERRKHLPHKNNIENRRKKQTIHRNSENRRDNERIYKERIYNRHRITDNKNATRREDSKGNRITENHKQIPRCKQKRSIFPRKNPGKPRI